MKHLLISRLSLSGEAIGHGMCWKSGDGLMELGLVAEDFEDSKNFPLGKL